MWTDETRARYDRRGLRYTRDLTDEEWAEVAPLIPPARPGGNKRTVNMHGSVPDVLQNRLRPGGHGMRVMCDVTNPVAREHTMTKGQGKGEVIDLKGHLERDADFLRSAVKAGLEAEMTDALGAAKSERTDGRLGYRAGFYQRSLITRVGTLDLRVPQDRAGRFSTELFERCQHSEKALVGALAEMYVQGVSTRKVKAVTVALCGHEFSASSISQVNKSLDAALTEFARRRLTEPCPYLILDARYERIREGGVIASQAVLIAVAVDGEGRRQVLAVELANRQSRSSWRDFLLDLKQRGLHGVEFVVSDDHPGLKAAIREVLTEAAWQRCYVHFLRNALDYVPRKVDDDCLMVLRWFYDRRDLAEVRRDLAAWPAKWQGKYPKLCGWVEDNIEETPTFYRLPLAHLNEIDQHAGTSEPGDQTPHACGADFSECRQLPAPGAGARGRDARELAGGDPLSEHGSSEGAQETDDAQRGMMALHRARQKLAPCSRPSRTLRAGGLRPSLTAAARDAPCRSGRDEETPVSRTRKPHSAYSLRILQNLTHTTTCAKWPTV